MPHWIRNRRYNLMSGWYETRYTCSDCRYQFLSLGSGHKLPETCPNCGADMRGGRE